MSLTKEQIKGLPPKPFEPVLAYTRFKNQTIVPVGSPYFKPARYKKVWDGSKYDVKMERGYWPVPKKKKI